MGFDINESIATKLTYKDVALIAAMSGEYQDRLKKNGYTYENSDIFKHAVDLVNRLGAELYDCPQEEPNGH